MSGSMSSVPLRQAITGLKLIPSLLQKTSYGERVYLDEHQKLSSQKPESAGGSANYVHDPENPVWTVGGANMITQTPQGDRRNQGQMNLADPQLAPFTMTRSDVLSFESNVLTDTFSIIGFPVANVFASSHPLENHSDSTSTDFFVRILDVISGRPGIFCSGRCH